jgi:hypothetical protein
MKTKIITALSVLAIVFAACQKDPEEDVDNGGNNTEDYQPVSAGSTWQYTSLTSGTYTETALAGDTTIEGEKYYKFDNSENGRRYINKSNGVYKQRGYVQEIDKTVDLTYLKDAAVGTTWSEDEVVTQGGFSIPIKVNYTILSRENEKVVNGNTYKDVIAVGVSITASVLGTNVAVATARQYYAKGVGAISSSLNFKFEDEEVNDSTYLVSHDIK